MAEARRLGSLLEAKVLALKGVSKKKSRWMDKDAFYIGQREFAHLQRDDQIDVRLTKTYQKKYSDLIRGDKSSVQGKPIRVGPRTISHA